MGNAKWWVCESCVSLNDLPANKCYKCREPKPAAPKLIDDEYSEVSGRQQRVGVTVDLSQVGDLTRPDPIEQAEPGGIMEAFDKVDDPYADLDGRRPTPPTPRYDPYAGDLEQQRVAPATPRPMRDPIRRGIDAIGGRQWADAYGTPPSTIPPPARPPQGAQGAPPPPPPPGTQSRPAMPPPRPREERGER
jgi:hypothetical protein